jgi:proline dehydrogenase
MNFRDGCLALFGNRWPGKLFVRRFVAGDTMEDAFRIAEELNRQGFETIINFLGEEVRGREQACENAGMYCNLIGQIQRKKLKARVSVKPSQLGLRIDQHFYRLNLLRVARDALIRGVLLEIDMETEDAAAATIQETIYLAEYYTTKHFPWPELRQALAMNFKDSFVYLYNLTAAGIKIRLCKGAYPSKYTERQVAERFLHAAEILLQRKANPDFATHDLELIKKVFQLKNEYPAVCGFQFLLGLRKRIWKELVEKNERAAIYAPFGTNWLPYAKRRWKYLLKKLPSILRELHSK